MLHDNQRLKLDLLVDGLEVSAAARKNLSQEGTRPLTLADYATTSGISLELDKDIWVNAPIQEFNPNMVTSSPHLLDYSKGIYYVHSGSLSVEARPVPVPEYAGRLNSSEERYDSYAITHTDRVRISPIEGCGLVCTFCDLPYKFRYRRKRIDGLVDSVRAALDDPLLPAKHVLISGGTPKPEDYSYQKAVYRAVAEKFPNVSVDIIMTPSPGLLDLEDLKAIGINGLSINLEIFGEEMAKKFVPLKMRLGVNQYLDFIESAVNVFGTDRIRSLIIVGLEPLEDTLRGVEALAERGCQPVLSPFRPDPATPLRDHPAPGVEFLERAYLESLEIVTKHSVKLGPKCIPCHHNTLTFPDGSDFYHFH